MTDHKSTVDSTTNNINIENNDGSQVVPSTITMQPIGYISSIYRLCVGTPRQGLLAPNSRGRINLFANKIAFDSIQDLEGFSHVWIVFVFHLNNSSPPMDGTLQQQQQKQNQFPSKIKPPALGGKKVGIFATRSPHRPNPIGFSLCKLDRVIVPSSKNKNKNKENKMTNKSNDVLYYIDISGLDLVDGTPVLDIKPYVPHYDSVGYSSIGTTSMIHDDDDNENDDNNDPHATSPTSNTTATSSRKNNATTLPVTLPQWVSDGLDKRRHVEFTSKATYELNEIFLGGENGGSQELQLQFYGKHTGRDKTDMEAMENFRNCIRQVLSVDVRSKWQTSKARKGKSRAEMTERVKEMNKVTVCVKEGGDDKGIGGGGDNESKDLIHEENHQQQQQQLEDIDDDDGGFCTQQLDRLLIKFRVRPGCAKEDENLAVDTQGSGADDVIVVVGVEYLASTQTCII